MRLVHPQEGEVRPAYETLGLTADDDQQLIVHLPADATSAAPLDHHAGRRPAGALSGTVDTCSTSCFPPPVDPSGRGGRRVPVRRAGAGGRGQGRPARYGYPHRLQGRTRRTHQGHHGHAGAVTTVHTITITGDPAADTAIWRIGDWNGTPAGFKNASLVTYAHPSDSRAAWTAGTMSSAPRRPRPGPPTSSRRSTRASWSPSPSPPPRPPPTAPCVSASPPRRRGSPVSCSPWSPRPVCSPAAPAAPVEHTFRRRVQDACGAAHADLTSPVGCARRR